MWRKALIGLNNRIVRWRRVRVPASNVLLLLPHCMHRDTCAHNVVQSLDMCVRCGQCGLAEMVGFYRQYGVMACVVGGGQQALQWVRQDRVRVVVAVACERELVQGIVLAFPKPVIAVPNRMTEGPCRNTVVDRGAVVAALDQVTILAGTDSEIT